MLPSVADTPGRVQHARTVIVVLLAVVLLFVLLAVWQRVEQGSGNQLAAVLTAPAAAPSPVDALELEGEGISLIQTDDDGDTFWYASEWSIQQSRVLVERALSINGWESAVEDQTEVATFIREADATHAPAALIACFYEVGTGCTVLIELW